MCQTVKLSPQILLTWFCVSCCCFCLEGFSFLKLLRLPSSNIHPISARSSHVVFGSKAACNMGSKLLTSYSWKSKFSVQIMKYMFYVKSVHKIQSVIIKYTWWLCYLLVLVECFNRKNNLLFLPLNTLFGAPSSRPSNSVIFRWCECPCCSSGTTTHCRLSRVPAI